MIQFNGLCAEIDADAIETGVPVQPAPIPVVRPAASVMARLTAGETETLELIFAEPATFIHDASFEDAATVGRLFGHRLNQDARGQWVWPAAFKLTPRITPASGVWDPLESTCRHASLSIL